MSAANENHSIEARHLATMLAARAMLAALKHAVKCVEYCRSKHKDAQSGTGFPVELHWQEIIKQAEAAGIEAPAHVIATSSDLAKGDAP